MEPVSPAGEATPGARRRPFLGASLFRPSTLDSPRRSTIARGGAYSAASSLVLGITRFLTNLLVGRIGGPNALGTVATAMSTAQLLSLLWPTATGSAASRYVAHSRGQADPALTSAVAAHLARRTMVASLFLAAAAIPIWIWVEDGTVAGGLVVFSLVIAYAGHAFTRGVQYGAGQVPRAAAWDIIASTLALAAVAVAVALGAKGSVLVIPLAVAHGLYTLANWPWGARGRLERSLRREVDTFIALAVVGTLASSGFLQSTLLVARVAEGRTGAGQYAAALALATPVSGLVVAFSQVLFPSLAEAWGRRDLDSVRRQTDRATRALVTVMPLAFGSLALLSGLLTSVIWGPDFSRTADVLPLLLIAVMATTLSTAATSSMTTRSREGMLRSALASLAGAAVGCAMFVLLVPRFGLHGVAIAYLAGTAVVASIPIVIVWRADGHKWSAPLIRLTLGLILIGGLLMIENRTGMDVRLEPALTVFFAVVWIALTRKEWLVLRDLVTRRRGPSTRD